MRNKKNEKKYENERDENENEIGWKKQNEKNVLKEMELKEMEWKEQSERIGAEEMEWKKWDEGNERKGTVKEWKKCSKNEMTNT